MYSFTINERGARNKSTSPLRAHKQWPAIALARISRPMAGLSVLAPKPRISPLPVAMDTFNSLSETGCRVEWGTGAVAVDAGELPLPAAFAFLPVPQSAP